MRNWFRLVCIGALGSMAVAACTMTNANVPPAQLMSELQAGRPMLDCSYADCGLAWGLNSHQAAILDATGQWRQLALLVMKIGYIDDLAYYYLGHAAENLGYLQAAENYHRISERLSVTAMACSQLSHICNSHVLPDELYPRLEVVESQLAAESGSASSSSTPQAPETPQKRRVARRSSHPTATAASTAGGQASGSSFVVPTPSAGTPSGSGFVEPAPTGTTGTQSANP